ncbi:MAG: threonine--tRNA ligase [Geminicoccaceae bacterium]|nr:threonine--tRNA ligase [Geminicoccaceae bacterium]MCS7267156.1 threonine--tRNA ligase [Geminicoccaceae bacterium]MCX7630600.1 threonine--tRNA ligase [Geminicoccaceae bacterium]MDW8124063.1 threonine--tRNA ligase [Geminicoccaceae bacterium]MDW8341247.1 threonine--tRNA ligase [Geminicoccaceae bacterium]
MQTAVELREAAACAREVAITLPDGSTLAFDHPPTGREIAEAIGPALAREAVAVIVDGELRDLDRPIEKDARVRVVRIEDPEALELIRHDCAHVMAQAVQELFPGTQVTIGPPIETGFYYDFYREEPFSTDDLARIEARMAEIVAADVPFRREEVSREEARRRFAALGERFKLEILDAIPEGEPVTIYHQDGWFDLCRGPHGPSTGKIGAFKLLKVAGAYWRGDPRRPQLQRIYGTAFPTKAQLDAYLHQLEEAERRDHRRLGREMDLFHVQEEAPGSVFWHPKGWTLWRQVEDYVRRRLSAAGYVEVRTPQLVDRSLWERSGHWEKFRAHMFTLEAEERSFALKPMNCPCHVQIFNQGIKSYRDLPLRMAEFGSCHRNEPSGALHGIMRVRAFTQDDAHIFCTPEQITSESVAFVDLLRSVYADFGFPSFKVRFADRPPVRAGSDEVWDQAERALEEACAAAGVEFELNPGEGAFYGPKLEFVLEDAIGRAWQCGTLQVDFVLPERLDASYIGPDGAKHRPVMLHRAILGSLERFIGILIEHYAGKLPVWLAPVQAVVATITNEVDDWAREVHARLAAAGVRAELDLRPDKISYKVREHSLAKVPFILAVGAREKAQGTVALRRLGSREQEILALDAALALCLRESTPPDLARAR